MSAVKVKTLDQILAEKRQREDTKATVAMGADKPVAKAADKPVAKVKVQSKPKPSVWASRRKPKPSAVSDFVFLLAVL